MAQCRLIGVTLSLLASKVQTHISSVTPFQIFQQSVKVKIILNHNR